MSEIRFTLNGSAIAIDTPAEESLADILRDRLSLTATKIGCHIGRCGACLALVDGEAVNACLVMAYRLYGATVVTGEGLDADPVAAIVREAFDAEASFQCGYCAPGFVMSLTALLKSTPDAGEDAIRTALGGNICRCSGYHSILRGARRAVALLAPAAND